MSNLIQIHIDSAIDSKTVEFYQTFISARYAPMIEMLGSQNLWSNAIEKIVFCQSIKSYIDFYNSEFGTNHSLTFEKEYNAVSKNLYHLNSGITILLPLLHPESEYKFNIIDQLFLNQTILVKANEFLPNEFDNYIEGLSYEDTQNLDSIIHFLFVSWFPNDFTRSIIFEIEDSDESILTDHNVAMAVFKRKLKKILYDCNSDDDYLGKNWQHLLNSYLIIFRDLINRILENHPRSLPDNIKLKNKEEAKIIYELVSEIKINKEAILNREKFDLNKIKYLFQEFARLFDIHICQDNFEGNKCISLKIYTNPKQIFKESLVETEVRFIAFIDILGFTNMINEYDRNPLSPLLQDIHKALNHSLDVTVRKFGGLLDESSLEYKLFSDCLCVSIPFFNSKADYESSFSILLSLVKTYQNTMMRKGYYVRGAIALGSHFSDENMIFSGGLVKAYELETHKAIYPRIIIEDGIVNRLRDYNPISFSTSLSNEIIESQEENLFFVNPFINVTRALSLFKDLVTENILDVDLEDLSNEDKIKMDQGKDAFKDFLGIMYDSHSEKESDKYQIEEILEILEEKIAMLPPLKKPNLKKRLLLKISGKKSKVLPREKLIWLRELCEWYINRYESVKYKLLD